MRALDYIYQQKSTLRVSSRRIYFEICIEILIRVVIKRNIINIFCAKRRRLEKNFFFSKLNLYFPSDWRLCSICTKNYLIEVSATVYLKSNYYNIYSVLPRFLHKIFISKLLHNSSNNRSLWRIYDCTVRNYYFKYRFKNSVSFGCLVKGIC